METDSKQRIIDAAIKIIAKKGKHGIRMEEVAREADINRAMVYYYFATKDNLYFEVLKTTFIRLLEETMNDIDGDIAAGKSHKDIISNLIKDSFVKKLINNPDYFRIVIDALTSGMEDIPRAVDLIASTSNVTPFRSIIDVIKDGIDRGIFRDVDPQQTVISITGMVLIYFLSPGIMKLFDVKVDNEDEFISNRLNSIIDLILNGIMKR